MLGTEREKVLQLRLFKREDYLRKIRGFYHDEGMIKVITGVRRCGKSCLMQTIARELVDGGADPASVVYLDLDSRGLRSVKSADALERAIDEASAAAPNGTRYLFIDEVQNVKGYEEVVNAFRNDGGWSVFVTGSNGYLLSGELMTKLTGRYVEFEVQTLTFAEYEAMKAFLGKPINPNPVAEFDSYILEGGFPKALEYDSLTDKRAYVKSVVAEILEKDVRRRVQVRNMSVFERVRTYITNNFGATTSLANIRADLVGQGIDVKLETVARYVKILEDAKVVRRCDRFDMKSRKSLRGEQKYYLADLGFYFAANTDNRINYGPVLENIVYNYALSKGYEVSVGRIGKLECDFVMRSPEMDYAYVQVALTIMLSRETEDREYRPLEQIRDNYPKYVVTRSDVIQRRGGIKHVNALEFMLEGGLF